MKAGFLFAAACLCLLTAAAQEAGGVSAAVAETNSASGPLVLSGIIRLPGVSGGLNHMSASARSGLIFVTATLNRTIEVVDFKAGKVVRTLSGDKPNATRFCSEFNLLYATRGQNLVVYDGGTLDAITNIDLQNGLNEIHHDNAAKRLYVGCLNTDKAGIAVLDLSNHAVLGKLALPAKPMGFAVESRGPRLFANMPTLGQVAVADREKREILETWQLKDCSANYPMALDEDDHRLFVGCRKPGRMVVLDTTTGETVAELEIEADADDIYIDYTHHLICVTCGGGYLEVIEQRDPNNYILRQRIRTGERARTSYFCASLNELFVAVPEMGNHSAQIQIYTVR
jgi:hypothetical protein